MAFLNKLLFEPHRDRKAKKKPFDLTVKFDISET